MKYRKKPVVIEAEQFLGSFRRMVDFMGADKFTVISYDEFGHPDQLSIHTLEGNHIAAIGDFIIRGIAGEYYPCKPDIFDATYEPVVDEKLNVVADQVDGARAVFGGLK